MRAKLTRFGLAAFVCYCRKRQHTLRNPSGRWMYHGEMIEAKAWGRLAEAAAELLTNRYPKIVPNYSREWWQEGLEIVQGKRLLNGDLR